MGASLAGDGRQELVAAGYGFDDALLRLDDCIREEPSWLLRNASVRSLSPLDPRLTRSTLCGWVGAIAEALTPLHELLKQDVLASSYLQADDTRGNPPAFPCFPPPPRERCSARPMTGRTGGADVEIGRAAAGGGQGILAGG